MGGGGPCAGSHAGTASINVSMQNVFITTTPFNKSPKTLLSTPASVGTVHAHTYYPRAPWLLAARRSRAGPARRPDPLSAGRWPAFACRGWRLSAAPAPVRPAPLDHAHTFLIRPSPSGARPHSDHFQERIPAP